ncbi:carbohydrate ABC transporter permease [Caldalkalibacillus mannanilyticus]|uniref:carbohydrate ABC transporter permease n=1 Tax=Caldalkalibacillus mannanilyticus TaxID=1418 RepID=UPI000A7CEBA1|nr:carbohydrate ABC transporter permease [Caldalkalibacillus mannanilyticus]
MPQVSFEQKTAWERLQVSLIRSKVGRAFVYLCLLGWSLTTIAPLVWVVNNSFKTSKEVISDSFSLATNPTLENYQEAFSLINIGQSYMNSFIMSGGTVFFTLLFGGMAAYALSRFHFRLRGFIQNMLVLSLLIPSFGTVVPVYEILIKLGLVNTYWALIILILRDFYHSQCLSYLVIWQPFPKNWKRQP